MRKTSARHFPFAVVLLLAALAAGSACATGAPRGRPIEMGPTDTGPGSLEAVRRQLEGTWDLVQLETYPASGAPQTLEAKAVLTYDAYGNMTIEGRLAQPAASAAAAPLLAYKGRAVIDTAKEQLRLVDVTGAQRALPDEVSTAMIRKYAFDAGVLVLSIVDDTGRTTAKASWKKR
jgi:hypothetical protein